jgi:eukaryotic-like serine/threonine-protein kinase
VLGEILKRGTQLGRYEIRELLGRGGMGQVYRAWDPSLRRDVAIKVLGAPDEELLRRFSREAEAVSQLNHSNVVSILDFSAGPVPYIVMAYLRGEDLSTRLKRGPMSVGEAVDIILGVCAGVHACHCRGVVHRDLKPGNVFLHETPEGTSVKVLDFGVAILGKMFRATSPGPGTWWGRHAISRPNRSGTWRPMPSLINTRSGCCSTWR